MDCALWLNRKKIYSADEIPENLDVAALRGYFLAGSLVKWLREHGGEHFADRLSELSFDDGELNDKIAGIFGGVPVCCKGFGKEGDPSGDSRNAAASSFVPAAGLGSFGSFELSSGFPFAAGSFGGLGSFGSFVNFLSSFEYGFGSGAYSIGSYLNLFGSYLYGSYEYFLGSYEYFLGGLGSFGSFSLGSFNFSEWEWEWLKEMLFSSFGYGSFGWGSFWEWARMFGMFGSFNFLNLFGSFGGYLGSFGGFGSYGSFGAPTVEGLPIDEYDLILLKTLMNCPLDRFGYGIHNI